MAPLWVLSVATLIARLVGAAGLDALDSWPAAVATGLACMFLLTGTAHFTPRSRREGLIAIVPARLRHAPLLVTSTGVLELIGALALLVPPHWGAWRASAAWSLAALMVVMFPANLYAAASPRSPFAPTTPLRLRAPLQGIYIAAAVLVAASS